MKEQVDLHTLKELLEAIDFHKRLSSDFRCLKNYKKYEEKLQAFWSDNGKYKEFWNSPIVDDFKDYNIHIILQNWSNTSGGWEGIGGSAMISSHTIILETHVAAFIYYNGELAYIAYNDQKYKDIRLNRLPGMSTCGKKLNIIYKSR